MENKVFMVDELEKMQLELNKKLIKEANGVSINLNNKSNFSKVFNSLEENIEIFNIQNEKQEDRKYSYV